MKCDKCGKDIDYEGEPAIVLQLQDAYPYAERTLGKYYGTKANVNGVLTWAFCFECVLHKFLGGELTVEDTIRTKDSLSSILSNYPERLKQRRKGRGLTLNQLGQMSGVTASAIARIEKEERAPSILTVLKIEKVLEERGDNTR